MRVIAGVVQRSPRLTSVEHGADVRERQIAGDTSDEDVELFFRCARFGEEASQLDLANVHANATPGEIGLHELLERIVAATDGEKIDGKCTALARALSVGRTAPAGRIEERVGGAHIVLGRDVTRERIVRWHRTRCRGAISGERSTDDAV